MNVYNEDNNNGDLTKCNNCEASLSAPKSRIHHSKLCLHKLCEPCIQKLFVSNTSIICKIPMCQKSHEQKDYNIRTREELYAEFDNKIRSKIMKEYYKRPEDFSNEDEYDNYLEEIEDKSYISNFYLLVLECKDLKNLIKYLQSKSNMNTLNVNIVKREDDLNTMEYLRRKNDPMKLYNSKIEVGDEMQVDINEINKSVITTGSMNLLPQRQFIIKLPFLIEDAKVTIVRDLNMMIQAGGYNFDKAYQELSKYAKQGFI